MWRTSSFCAVSNMFPLGSVFYLLIFCRVCGVYSRSPTFVKRMLCIPNVTVPPLNFVSGVDTPPLRWLVIINALAHRQSRQNSSNCLQTVNDSTKNIRCSFILWLDQVCNRLDVRMRLCFWICVIWINATPNGDFLKFNYHRKRWEAICGIIISPQQCKKWYNLLLGALKLKAIYWTIIITIIIIIQHIS